MKHAIYSDVLYRDVAIVVIDSASDGEGSFTSLTVTNDAEYVVKQLAKLYDIFAYPIVYRDSEGNFDQLCINKLGLFSHFGFLNTTDRDIAIARAVKPAFA
jgi:hypothetical protein